MVGSIRTMTGFYDRNGITTTSIDAKMQEAINFLHTLPNSVEKGDLIGVDSNGKWAKLPKGKDGQILKSNSSSALGVSWENPTIGLK